MPGEEVRTGKSTSRAQRSCLSPYCPGGSNFGDHQARLLYLRERAAVENPGTPQSAVIRIHRNVEIR